MHKCTFKTLFIIYRIRYNHFNTNDSIIEDFVEISKIKNVIMLYTYNELHKLMCNNEFNRVTGVLSAYYRSFTNQEVKNHCR